MRVLTLLKQASAEASETATVDQAGDHTHQNKAQHSEFDLEVSEQIPTSDQLRSILEYAGNDRIKDVVEGATSVSNALQKISQDRKAFQFPVVSTSKSFPRIDADMNRPSIGTTVKQVRHARKLRLCNLLIWVSVIGDDESEILKLVEALPKR